MDTGQAEQTDSAVDAPTATAGDEAAIYTPETFTDEDGTLTRLHPNHRTQMRVEVGIVGAVLSVGALVLDVMAPFWPGVIFVPVFLFAILLVWRMPHRRFSARGYAISDDRLRVVRGILFRSDTVVPFGRVQHIDVDRGPLERYFGLATITLYTAGSHNSSVNLPGLEHETALSMREKIRAHIKREAL